MELIDRLREIKERRDNLAEELADPEVVADMTKFTRLNKEYSNLEKFEKAYKEYSEILSNIQTNKEILDSSSDSELKEMARMELDDIQDGLEEMEESIKQMLIPADPGDDKNAILELRAGTGGDEAALFAGDLYRMYTRYCENKGWKMEVISVNHGTTGGYKEVSFSVEGENVYGILKYESGVHRVQRVPATESQGRLHTSAASVVVLPEADEFDVEVNEKDIKRDTFRASGAGGQHVNKTDSAIRLTHMPTGIVVECQDERSQLKNYNKALKVLKSRIYEIELRKIMEVTAQQRKTIVSTGDRSAKIRTYNFPQSRVTDHRINLTLYNLNDVLDGQIDEILDALKLAENAEKLKAGESI